MVGLFAWISKITLLAGAVYTYEAVLSQVNDSMQCVGMRRLLSNSEAATRKLPMSLASLFIVGLWSSLHIAGTAGFVICIYDLDSQARQKADSKLSQDLTFQTCPTTVNQDEWTSKARCLKVGT